MNNYFLLLQVLLTCICFYLINSERVNSKKIVWFVYCLIFFTAGYFFLTEVIYRISHPEIWDFTCFYLYGKTAAGNYNYYLPENFQIIFASLHLPFPDLKDFVDEVVKVGFPYPPPTILYFLPLGYLSYNTALIVWTLINLIFLVCCIYLVYEQYLKKYKLNGLVFSSILFFIFSPVFSTIFFSQTNFILLFLLLLMKKYSNTKYAGIFLAIAVFTKPYMLIFGVFFLVKKKWHAISYFIFTAAVLMAITFAIFGKAPFISYVFNNSASRLPKWVFSEDINQSLHAVLLRHNIISIDKPIAYMCISGIIMLLVLVYSLVLVKKQLEEYIWPLLLLAAILIYPGTLSHYGALLLFVIFQFFNDKEKIFINFFFAIPIIAILYYLCNTSSLFMAIIFLLAVIIYRSWYVLKINNRKVSNSL
jgi:hypothetical protein